MTDQATIRRNATVGVSKPGGTERPTEYLLRYSPFSFRCNRCCRCCHDKVIRVNPYEVSRLAGQLGIGTTEFLRRYTFADGTALRATATGVCVFLSTSGCGVHPARPLVCRLYPLGRHVRESGQESFIRQELEPRCQGAPGTDGCVGDYLAGQEAGPFIAAVDRYLGLVGRMMVVSREKAGSGTEAQEILSGATAELLQESGSTYPAWLDMDPVVSGFCAARGIVVPSDADARMDIHITAITEWLETL